MSRTIKAYPFKCYRHPKGQRKAILNDARSVPPSAWDDVNYDDQTRLPFKIAQYMREDGRPDQQIETLLNRKFKVPRWRIRDEILPFLN